VMALGRRWGLVDDNQAGRVHLLAVGAEGQAPAV
jgi:hypothetical protein